MNTKDTSREDPMNPHFTNEQKKDAGKIVNAFRDRRRFLREKDLSLGEYEFDDGIETYQTYDRHNKGKTLAGLIEFGLPLSKIFQSQIMQDIWALYEVDGKKGGYFIDFGATNGATLSNSLIMERFFDWDGIVAEPNPNFHKELHKKRKCHISTKAVHSTTGEQLDFICAEREMFSRLGAASDGIEFSEEEIQKTTLVETIKLNDLMDEFKSPDIVDFVSIDTEGSELDILQAYDFSKRHINMFAIEHNYEPRRGKIFEMLTAHGYVRRFPELSRFDDWYVHQDMLKA